MWIGPCHHRLVQTPSIGGLFVLRSEGGLFLQRVADGVGLTAADSEATRVYELLHPGRFVLLSLTGDPVLEEPVDAGWGSRVEGVTFDKYDERADLDGVTEVLVRPDGHVAWATRTTDGGARIDDRVRALTAWAGTAS